MVLTSLGAYVLSRKNYMFRKPITLCIIFTMYFSGGLIALYLWVSELGMIDTRWAVLLPTAISTYNMIVLRSGFDGIPESLIEAAKMDGASELTCLVKIVMPLSKPVLASIGFLFLVDKWNDWMTSMLYIRDPNLYSLQYLLQRILNEAEYLRQLADAGSLMGGEVFPTESFRYAMALVVAGPVLLIFPFFQKYFAKGMTLGGVKG